MTNNNVITKTNAAARQSGNPKSTMTAKESAQLTASGIGQTVLDIIAMRLGAEGGECFDKDGLPTDETMARVSELAGEGISHWLILIEPDWIDRGVINYTRKKLKLPPVS